jgi:hypothetical protein
MVGDLPNAELVIPNFDYPMPNTKKLHGKGAALSLEGREPLFTREQVARQYGVDLGDLQAVVGLPLRREWQTNGSRTEDVYCFKRPASTGRHAKSEYLLIGKKELAEVYSSTKAGREPAYAQGSVISASAGEPARIGREEWLPGIGYDTALLAHDEDMRERTGSIGRHQAMLSVNEQGDLHIEELGSFNGTTVFYGNLTQEALDQPTGQHPYIPTQR